MEPLITIFHSQRQETYLWQVKGKICEEYIFCVNFWAQRYLDSHCVGSGLPLQHRQRQTTFGFQLIKGRDLGCTTSAENLLKALSKRVVIAQRFQNFLGCWIRSWEHYAYLSLLLREETSRLMASLASVASSSSLWSFLRAAVILWDSSSLSSNCLFSCLTRAFALSACERETSQAKHTTF